MSDAIDMGRMPAAGETSSLLIPGPAGAIEALLAAPRQAHARPAFAIVCHPHPLFGGAMSNKVAYTLASCAQKAGLHTLRFNFRGVGRSEGAHDEGRGEADDVVFLAQWLHKRLPGADAVLAGFSFGAFVSLQAAVRVTPVAQVSIAPPFGKAYVSGDPPPRPPCPWLVVHSRDDEVVGYSGTVEALKAYEPPPKLVTLDGAGHFFHGKLRELDDVVQPFLAGTLDRLVGD